MRGNITALTYSTEDLGPVRAHAINPNTATCIRVQCLHQNQLPFPEHQVCRVATRTIINPPSQRLTSDPHRQPRMAVEQWQWSVYYLIQRLPTRLAGKGCLTF